MDDITPTKLYRVFLMDTELQKRQDDMLVAEDVRVSPSGVLECNRLWSDTNIRTKIFYNGPFYCVQMDEEEIADFHEPTCEHGGHDEDED